MSKRVLLIDGDVLVYKTAFASEKVIDWGDGLITLHSKVDEAADSIDAQIAHIKDVLKGDELVVALTCHETVNFRKEFFPQYKENRTEKRKPIAWKAMRQHLLEKYDAKTKPNLEADDILGILSTKLGPIAPGLPAVTEKIIVSIDKDFKTIPGLFYNLNDGKSGEVQKISEEDADHNFMVQTLTGDSTDNYPGCQGIGPKRAKAILDEAIHDAFSDTSPDEYCAANALPILWRAVLKAFDAKGFGAEFALTQARCARILRASDYDFANKKPNLWSPPR
jgi:5'-3' exonuclease